MGGEVLSQVEVVAMASYVVRGIGRLGIAALLSTGALALAVAGCGGDDAGGAAIEGTVEQDGAPLDGVTVELSLGGEEEEGDAGSLPDEASEPLATATTDGDGRFTFDADPGEYSVVVDIEMEDTAGCTAIATVVVEEGSSTSADFDLPSEPPAGGITFIDDYWFACFATD